MTNKDLDAMFFFFFKFNYKITFRLFVSETDSVDQREFIVILQSQLFPFGESIVIALAEGSYQRNIKYR